MVYLNRIYTKTGDRGETSLGNGERVPKTDVRIAAYGTVDELNSVLGICLTCELSESFSVRLKQIQNDLFDLGADLCVPESDTAPDPDAPPPLRVAASQAARLENWIDEWNQELEPLTSFILPGGSVAAAQLHLARTVCRRAELAVYQLMNRDSLNPQIAIYLNRLSDLLFVMARVANANGKNDVLWIPGGNRERDTSCD